nr:hypothetical protein [Andreprevotia chitinilytica]
MKTSAERLAGCQYGQPVGGRTARQVMRVDRVIHRLEAEEVLSSRGEEHVIAGVGVDVQLQPLGRPADFSATGPATEGVIDFRIQ